MMTNRGNKVIYTGMTNDLLRRVNDHKNGRGSCFTTRYNVSKLVYQERFDQVQDAIAAEKRIKAGYRAKKIALIESVNPEWEDLLEKSGV
jgi:putative endonuclease